MQRFTFFLSGINVALTTVTSKRITYCLDLKQFRQQSNRCLSAGHRLGFLDFNGNGKWDGCRMDKCLGTLAVVLISRLPATGRNRKGADWYRPPKHWRVVLGFEWKRKLDSCTIDACIGPFDQPGDLPVVGKW